MPTLLLSIAVRLVLCIIGSGHLLAQRLAMLPCRVALPLKPLSFLVRCSLLRSILGIGMVV
jgi:hypothetical protein